MSASWIEVVINQLDMKDLISDKTLIDANDKIDLIKQRTMDQTDVFKVLQKEVSKINFDHIFKDPRMLKNIRKTMT